MNASSISLRRYLSWLAGLSAGIRLRLTLRVLAGMARVGVMLLFVYVCKQLVDMAVSPSWSMSATPLFWSLGGCVAAQLALGAFISRIGLSVATDSANRLRLGMFDRSMRALYGRGFHSADVIERMKKDVDTTVELVCISLPGAIVTAFQLLAAFGFLAWLDWRLALVMVSIMPVALLLGKAFLRRMRRLSAQIRQLDSATHSHVQEHLRHRRVDAAFQATPRAVGRMSRLQARMYRLVMRRNNYSLFSRTLVQAAFAAGYLTAFIWGVVGLSEGALTFGVMTAFLQLVGQVQRPALELAQYLPGFVYGFASAERIIDVCEAPVEDEPCREMPDVERPVGLRVSGVSFAYDDAPEWVFRDLSADFVPGSMTAITGVTGRGKTTLLRLAMALIKPQSGCLEWYDTAGHAEPVDAQSRSLIACVPQGNTLFSGTVRSNLAMGRPDATEADMRRELELACCDFVNDLPAGLDTRIGEGASSLSEGQAQRLAIARALLREAPVLLLDEPTSALDPDTERRLMASLAALTPRTTVIIITHRKLTASLCTACVAL